jgi:hypothetical protein
MQPSSLAALFPASGLIATKVWGQRTPRRCAAKKNIASEIALSLLRILYDIEFNTKILFAK